MWNARRTWMIAAIFASTSMAACSDSATAVAGTEQEQGTGDRRLGSDGSSATLIECPSTTTQTSESILGPLGGKLSLGGFEVILPVGALLEPTRIVLTVPASRYLEIDVSVPGTEHFVFQKAIVVVVDYSRCDPAATRSVLSAWYIDSSTKKPLEQMLSIDDKLTRRVVFTTGHLSGYALAN